MFYSGFEPGAVGWRVQTNHWAMVPWPMQNCLRKFIVVKRTFSMIYWKRRTTVTKCAPINIYQNVSNAILS